MGNYGIFVRKIAVGILAAAVAAGLSGCADTASEKAAEGESPENVTVILDYVANTNHTGMYVALDQGYYKEDGMDVSIVEPTEGATATLIAVGKGDFGISYQEDVTIARTSADPLPVKAVAALIQHNTSGFVTYGDKDIHSPKDFEGKTYAGWGGPGEEAVLKAVMAKDGGDFSKLDMVISDGSGFEALKDKVDVMWFFEGWDNIKCRLNDFPINYMELRQLDKRLDYYTPVIIASEDTLKNKPEMTKKFLEATAKGYRYAIEHPKESAEILHKYAPDYSLEMLTMSQEYLAGKYMEDTKRWGEMKDSVWDNYTDFLVEYGVIEEDIPADQYKDLAADKNLTMDVRSGGTLNLFLNTTEGVMADEKVRQAALAALNCDDILMASYGDADLYKLNAGWCNPDDAQWGTEAGSEYYNQNDVEKAKKLLSESSYNNEKIVLVTTPEYNEMYNATLVVQEQLKAAGFNAEVESYDFSTFMEHRADPKQFSMYITSNSYNMLPIQLSVLDKGWAGLDRPEVTDGIKAIRSASSNEEAKAAWEDLQSFIYEYGAASVIGHFTNITAMNSKVENYQYLRFPIYWNITFAE